MRFPLLALVLLVPLAAACAAGPAAQRPDSSSTDYISTEELRQHDGLTAFEALRRLRPTWLSHRPSPVTGAATSRRYPVLHVDGIRQPDMDPLYEMDVSSVRDMRYVSASDATTRFGTGYSSGAILVRTVY